MNNDDSDAAIPVLTEIIGRPESVEAASPVAALPSLSLATEAGAMPGVHGNADSVAVIAVADMPPPAASDDQWQALERKISERVLRQLQNRIDSVLEHRIRDSLADALQLAVDDMAANIRRGLHQTLEDVIARVVTQEIAHLQMAHEKPATDSGDDSD